MILELISTNETDVWASVYANKNRVKYLLLKPGDNKKIAIDNSTENIEVKFNEKISLLGHMMLAVWELLSHFINYHEKVMDLVNCNFITTEIQPADTCETVKVVYGTEHFQNAMRDTNIGLVESDKCKSRYVFDEKSFREFNRNDIIQLIFTGLIISISFISLFTRYFSIYNQWTCIVLIVFVLFLNLFFYFKKKETRDVRLIGKFKEDLGMLNCANA